MYVSFSNFTLPHIFIQISLLLLWTSKCRLKMKQNNKADLDLFEVTPWLWVTSNDFYKHFSSIAITKSNELKRQLLSIINSLLVEKILLWNQNTVAILENIFETVRSYTVLRYMFWVYLDRLCFFFKIESKNTSLKKWVISSSKSLLSCNKTEILSKSSKYTNKAPSSVQPRTMFTIYMQLSLWRIDFVCDLKLVKNALIQIWKSTDIFIFA